jgi:CheY-like chemotaxis protein
MPEGGQLSISAQNVVVDEMTALANPGAQSGPHVYIAIADSGCGIPPDIIDRIFDPFFTTKNQGKGTGLGLATVLGIVKAHGGFLSVKSAVAQGTEFQIYLPAVFEFAEAEPKTPANAVPLRGGGETLLVIDDEACVREIVGDTLEAYGYRVILAPDGLSGIALYRQHASEIDAVLTDMMMPNMQGAEVIAALHGIKPDLPIVAMSGLIESQKFGLTPKAGKLEILKKPMNTEDLLRSIQSLLKYPGTIVR